MGDNVRKRMHVCMCDWVTLLYSRKLMEHCKPGIMENIKNIFKKKKKTDHMIQHFHLWVDTWKKSKEEFERICTPIFREILFTAATRKPTCPSMDESRIQSIHTMGILFQLREGMLTPALTWTLTLCWVKEARHRRTNTIGCVVIGFTEMRTKVVAPRAWGWRVPVEEKGSSCLVLVSRLSVWKSSGDGQWWWSFNKVNILKASELQP